MPPRVTPVAVRSRAPITDSEAAAIDARLERSAPQEVVRWATERFEDGLVVAASFADTVLIDLAISADPDIEVEVW